MAEAPHGPAAARARLTRCGPLRPRQPVTRDDPVNLVDLPESESRFKPRITANVPCQSVILPGTDRLDSAAGLSHESPWESQSLVASTDPALGPGPSSGP